MPKKDKHNKFVDNLMSIKLKKFHLYFVFIKNTNLKKKKSKTQNNKLVVTPNSLFGWRGEWRGVEKSYLKIN